MALTDIVEKYSAPEKAHLRAVSIALASRVADVATTGIAFSQYPGLFYETNQFVRECMNEFGPWGGLLISEVTILPAVLLCCLGMYKLFQSRSLGAYYALAGVSTLIAADNALKFLAVATQ